MDRKKRADSEDDPKPGSAETILNIPKMTSAAASNAPTAAEDSPATTEAEEDDPSVAGETEEDAAIGEFDDGKSGKLTLSTLLAEGLIEAGDGVLTIEYLGQTFKGDLLPVGKIRSQETDLTFNNPSAWAIYCKKIVNPAKKSGCGWASVKYKGKKMDHFKNLWTKLKTQREAEEAEKRAEEEGARLSAAAKPPLEFASLGSMRIREHHELADKQATDNLDDLVETHPWGMTGKVQPFSLSVSSSALLIVDLHTHGSVGPVCGYLAGQWDINAHNLAITHAFPCLVKDAGDEEEAVKVEYEVYNTIYSRNLTLVGWYKSCSPALPKALPTLKDAEAQLEYQVKLLGTSDATYCPCVGLMSKPYNMQGLESDSLFYWVVPPLESSPNEYGKPMKMSYSVVTDPCLSQDLLEQIDRVIDFGTSGIRYHDPLAPGKTFATKLGESIIPKFPMDQDVRLWQYVRGKILEGKYVNLPDPLSDKLLGNGAHAQERAQGRAQAQGCGPMDGAQGGANGNASGEEEEIDDDEDSALVMSRRKSRASTGSNSGLKGDAIARMLQKQSPVPPTSAASGAAAKSQDGPIDFSSPSK